MNILNLDTPGKKVDIVIDSDAYNEVDDQFAISYALRSKENISVKAIYAAPFSNSHARTPEEGMEQSYNEILTLLDLLGEKVEVFRGSKKYLPDEKTPVISEAAEDIVKRAKSYSPDEPLYVVAIGAITTVASAILMDPSIVNNMAVIWLGGHAWHFKHSREFNMVQDVPAAQVILDSKVPFLQVPCVGVCDMLHTSVPELKYYLEGKNPLSDYLCKIVCEYNSGNAYCWSKVIWDVSAVAALLTPGYGEAVALPTPILTSDSLYAFDTARHHMLYVRSLNRDRIFADLFKTITKQS